jgi:hypothetical protein
MPAAERPHEGSTTDDVAAWLMSLGMTAHVGVFFKAKINGAKLLSLNEKQLRKLVKDEDDVIMLMRGLAQSRIRGSTAMSDDA